jgi:hypothetical protein
LLPLPSAGSLRNASIAGRSPWPARAVDPIGMIMQESRDCRCRKGISAKPSIRKASLVLTRQVLLLLIRPDDRPTGQSLFDHKGRRSRSEVGKRD